MKQKNFIIECHHQKKCWILNVYLTSTPVLPLAKLKKLLGKAMETLIREWKFSDVQMDLSLCGNQKIKTLNRLYRSKDKTTDVLSFPIHESLRISSAVKQATTSMPGMPLCLGDIVICQNVAKKQAGEFEVTIEEEILRLFFHGFLHLLGYDHEISKKEEKIMFVMEEKLLTRTYANARYTY